MNIVQLTQDWCQKNDAELIYLTKFGSHLYGTNTEASDTDYKGLFLPSKKACYLNRIKKAFTYSTGDKHGKNTVEDVDVQLWSLQYFMKLVSAGETNALDLLYSHTYPKMTLFYDSKMLKVFENHRKLFSILDCKAYTGYAISQAKKYGVKGSRLGVLKRVNNFLLESKACGDLKLSTIMADLLCACQDDSYCFGKEVNGVPSIIVCGKVHQSTITIAELRSRIYGEYEKYGERARMAEKSEGIDWKALSHAVRAICQMNELLVNGKIQYPLASSEVLRRIKLGEYTFPKVEKMIVNGLKEVDYALASVHNPIHIKDNKLVDRLILSFYE
jgi:hypothetical protein